jgi:hypothetical protein
MNINSPRGVPMRSPMAAGFKEDVMRVLHRSMHRDVRRATIRS